MDKVLKNHAFSSLHSLLHLFTLFLCISIESQIFLKKHNPIYHLLPLSISILLFHQFLSKSKPIYLLDFACLHPHPRLRVPTATFLEHLHLIDTFPDESISFMSKILTSSGLGEQTSFPPSLLRIPPKSHHRDSIAESQTLIFPILDQLFSTITNLSSRDIDVLVVNCSGFSPSPSLSSLIVNRYAMREDVKTFNVSGMGCSAGAVAIDIAANLLKLQRNYAYAIVVSTEILSTGWYAGRDRRKLLINCFFRTGSSAVLLTNVLQEKRRAKYELVKLVRANRSFDDRAYRSAIREEDSEGGTGFSIEPYLPEVAADTLRDGLVFLGMSMLPITEKLKYLLRRNGFVPDFGSVVRHYCLPASGRVVMEEIGRGLGLEREEMEAAVETFRRFGNQSSASVWYQLEYLEGKRRVRKGDRVLQLGMGSGPKCNSMVWERLGGVVKELEEGI